MSSTPLSLLDEQVEHFNAGPNIQSGTVSPLNADNAGDAFWGDDLSILLDKNRLVEFFPTSDQTLPERINAVSRLVAYVSIALSIYQGKATAAHFGILLLAMIYFMYRNQTLIKMDKVEQQITESKTIESFVPKEPCIMPTAQNPYMNFLLGDSPGRPPACKGPGVQETAANLLDKQLFEDVDDLFSKNANQRLFRTMPETTGIPDREKYANWLIKGEEGCKTTGFCPPFDDLRQQRQLIPEDLDNDFTVAGFNL